MGYGALWITFTHRLLNTRFTTTYLIPFINKFNFDSYTYFSYICQQLVKLFASFDNLFAMA